MYCLFYYSCLNFFPFAPPTQPTFLAHSQSPLHGPCLWVIHTCSVTSPFPSFLHYPPPLLQLPDCSTCEPTCAPHCTSVLLHGFMVCLVYKIVHVFLYILLFSFNHIFPHTSSFFLYISIYSCKKNQTTVKFSPVYQFNLPLLRNIYLVLLLLFLLWQYSNKYLKYTALYIGASISLG